MLGVMSLIFFSKGAMLAFLAIILALVAVPAATLPMFQAVLLAGFPWPCGALLAAERIPHRS